MRSRRKIELRRIMGIASKSKLVKTEIIKVPEVKLVKVNLLIEV